MAIKFNRKEKKLINIFNSTFWDLPSPSSISYFWNLGATLGICLVIQITRGILLSFHYSSQIEERFSSVVKIIREIWEGWIIRIIHMNGASVFFLFIYLHLFRGIFFIRATHKKVWIRGLTLIIILILISFLGYVLPWGQISYWAVAVITNLFSILPLIGESLVKWIWGGFSVGSPTLTRFYSLHFIIPFILTFIVLIHLYFLHQEGSRNNLGLNRNLDKIEFHPYFSIKDLNFIILIIITRIILSIFFPYILRDSINNSPANPIQTPTHIQPEWYFLSSYSILRALPRKTSGVLALTISVLIFFIIPTYKFKFSTKFSFYRLTIFWIIIRSFLFLIKIGSLPAEEPYINIRKIRTLIYFNSILILNL